ncbi:DUF6682 family protein [Mesobacterium pallidum]|uniref:phage adaptor protein n=1 Tax=Mesobacterium pallidum TaxID=2872037 RepID=UPI001EE18302|nr:DUF6682 family protein [Mesobacterium pallidum]
MAFTVGDIMREAQAILNDSNSVRWTLPELLKWVNNAQLEIVQTYPTAFASVEDIDLVAGVDQDLGASYYALMEIRGNADGTGRVTKLERHILDSQIGAWRDPAVLPRTAGVVHYVHDPKISRKSFMVCPGNDGTGSVTALVAVAPTIIAAPANPLSIDSYDALTIAIGDEYHPVILDYVLYRAFQKDANMPNSSQRAAQHLGQFQRALGVEAANNEAAEQIGKV